MENAWAQDKNLPPSSEKDGIPDSLFDRIYQPFFGDLDELRERRIIRVLTTYSRTNYFMTTKGFRGIEYELLKNYENYLNRGPLKRRYQTQLIFLPVSFNEITAKLRQGLGDIAAAGLTVTPERAALIDFTDPYLKNIKEVLIQAPDSSPIHRLEDLSGKVITVVANSSYVIHLQQFNLALGRLGLPPMEIRQSPEILNIEDLLEMTNDGIIQYTVVDSHIAELWQQALPSLVINDKIIFHYDGKIAWGVRKNNPKLKASLNQFIHRYAKPGRLLGNSLFNKYFKDDYWVQQQPSYTLIKKTNCLSYYFKLYADFYDFDWTLIAALAYQESRFNHNKRSHKGAVGIMQIKPSTAKHKPINIHKVKQLENNIEAGVKYLAYLRDRYYSSPEYDSEDRINFTLAAYNAGPAKIRKMQNLAKKQGLDPYKWFYNVETIVRRKIGQETVNYVANIRKYQIALKMSKEVETQKQLVQLSMQASQTADNGLSPKFEPKTSQPPAIPQN
jgi:membrane-bound lytic murein transglycosylase MltF